MLPVRGVRMPPSLGHDRAMTHQHQAVHLDPGSLDRVYEVADCIRRNPLRLRRGARQTICLAHAAAFDAMLENSSRPSERLDHDITKVDGSLVDVRRLYCPPPLLDADLEVAVVVERKSEKKTDDQEHRSSIFEELGCRILTARRRPVQERPRYFGAAICRRIAKIPMFASRVGVANVDNVVTVDQRQTERRYPFRHSNKKQKKPHKQQKNKNKPKQKEKTPIDPV